MDTSCLTTQVSTIIGQLHGLFDEIGVPSYERESRESEVWFVNIVKTKLLIPCSCSQLYQKHYITIYVWSLRRSTIVLVS